MWLTHLVQIGSPLAVLSAQSERTCLLLTLCPPLSCELVSTAQRSNHSEHLSPPVRRSEREREREREMEFTSFTNEDAITHLSNDHESEIEMMIFQH